MNKLASLFLLLFSLTSMIACLSTNVQSQKYVSYEESPVGHIIIKVQLDGREKRFLFDTGFTGSTLFVDSLRESFQIGTDARGNKVFGAFSEKKELKIKPLGIKHKIPFLLLEAPKSEIWDDMQVDGVLGANVINLYDWVVDLNGKTLKTMGRREAKEIKGNKNLFSIRAIDDRHQILFSLQEGGEQDTLLLDTGYNGILSYGQGGDFLGEAHVYRVGFTENVSGYSPKDTMSVRMCDVAMGDFSVSSLPVAFGHTEQNLLGIDFFRPFGKFYILNSAREYRFPPLRDYTFSYETPKTYKGVVKSIYLEVLGHHESDVDDIWEERRTDPKVVDYPKTTYSYDNRK